MNKIKIVGMYMLLAMALLIATSYGVLKLVQLNNLGVAQECLILNEEYHDGVYTIEEIEQMPYGEICINGGYIDVK